MGTNPKATWRQIKCWFELGNPNNNLTETQISKILNPKIPRGPSNLDLVQVQKLRPEAKRIKSGKHPKLDSALFQEQQSMQQRGVAISGLLLQEKANTILSPWIGSRQVSTVFGIGQPFYMLIWLTGWGSLVHIHY